MAFDQNNVSLDADASSGEREHCQVTLDGGSVSEARENTGRYLAPATQPGTGLVCRIVQPEDGSWRSWRSRRAATRGYFGVGPDPLSRAEASMLAGLPQPPVRLGSGPVPGTGQEPQRATSWTSWSLTST